MKLWEILFFSSLIGAVTFYPFIWGDVDYFLSDNGVFSLLSLTAVLLLFNSWLIISKKHHVCLDAIHVIIAFSSLIFLGLSIQETTPIFALWFLSLATTLLTFGYIITFHLFRKVEKDFIKKWKNILLIGLAVNFLRLILVFSLVFFPVILIAFLASGSMLLLRRHYE